MIKGLKKRYQSDSFSRNVLTLMTGTTIAQAIPIAISPILTRIYSPEDFGVFALFVAITSIFGSIANARYELAIMLPRKDEDAINISALGLIISTTLSLILLVLVILFNDYFTKLLKNDGLRLWLYFIPVAVFFTGLFKILSFFNNRKENYKDIANATIIKSIILAIVQLSVGFIKSGASGLISGQIISQMIANMRLLRNITKDKVLLSRVNKIKIIALAKRYKKFPKYSMWAVLANTLSQHLTKILISSFYSVTTLGFYSLVQRVLGMPSVFIGSSIGKVFFQQATKERQKTGQTLDTLNKTVKKLVMIGLPCFGILFFIIEDLFTFVFGEKWTIAGTYAKILLPLYFIRFVSSTVSTIVTIFEKQKSSLYINIILLFSVILILTISKLYLLDFYYLLILLTIVLSIEYLMFLRYYYSLSK